MLPPSARADTAHKDRSHVWFGCALAAAAASLACVMSAMALAQTATHSQSPQVQATAAADSSLRAAAPSRLAARSLMLDVASCGTRLVAVGERGRVLLSDDAGRTWRQARSVPASVTLTAVQCVDAQRAWAVGHAGVVLRTDDAGETWALQLDGVRAAQIALQAVRALPEDAGARRQAEQWVSDGPDKPFLALSFVDARHGLVVGAYGLIFSTDDGGTTWQPLMTQADNPQALHLNAVRRIGPQTYAAGEKGLLLRSDDGKRFTAVKSPYDGSWFTVDAAPEGGVAVAGLRGNVFVSRDGAASWRKLPVPSAATVTASRALPDGRLLLLAQDGAAHVLDAAGRIHPQPLPPMAPPTALIAAADGSLVLMTFRGPVRVAAATQARAAVNEPR